MSEKIILTPDEETADLLPGYIERRKTELRDIQAAVEAADFDKLATVGHNVKGTAGSYGAPDLGLLAEKIHAAAVEKDGAGCRAAVEAYGAYLLRVEVAS